MNANQKHKIRAAAAPIAASALLLSGTFYGISQSTGSPASPASGEAAELATTAQVNRLGRAGADTSDLSLHIELDSHPAHSMCADTLSTTGRLPTGCPLISSLIVTNHGDEAATHVVLTAPQPTGWVNPVIERPASGCALDENEDLRCELGTIPPGQSASVVVEGFTDASEEAYVMASVARVTADGIEQTPEDNVATDILMLQPEADLSVVVQPHTGALIPGANATWTAVVTNNGPSSATGVRILQSVTDAFEADFTDVTVTTSDGSPVTCKDLLQNANTSRCRADELKPGATMTMQVVGTLASDLDDAGALIHTTAGVSSSTIDPDASNNLATSSLTLAAPQASLLIGVDGPNQVKVGEKATWTFTVENTGPSNSTGTRVLLEIPPELSDVVVTSNHGTCSIGGCSLGTMLSSDDPTMPGNTADIAVTGVVNAETPSFMLRGRVSSQTSEGVSVRDANNREYIEAETTVSVDASPIEDSDEPLADMAISNFRITPVDPSFTGPGSQHRIQFTVTNEGPDAAKYPGFRLGRSTDAEANLGQKNVDQIPKDTAWKNLCQTTSRELMCQLNDTGVMAAGDSINVDYTITLASSGKAGSFPDYVYAYSATEDPNQLNDNAQADIVVGEPASEMYLNVEPVGTVANYGSAGTPGSVENPDGHPSFIAGGPFQYEVSVRVPEGKYSDASGVLVSMNLPAGFTANFANSADGQCTLGARITCLLPTVSAGSTSTINVGGTVSDQANNLHGGDSWAEHVPLQVTATSDTPEWNGQKILKSASTYVDIVESADLIAYITPDEAGTNDPGSIGFTVTVLNAGLSGVEHAEVSAMIPAGWRVDEAASNCVTPPTSSIDVNGDGVADIEPLPTGFVYGSPQAIVCQVGELPNGDRTGIVDAGNSGSIRVVLERVAGAQHSDGSIQFVTGGLGYDPDHNNNIVVGDLSPLSLSAHTANPFGGTGTSSIGTLPAFQRYLFPSSN